MDSLMLVNNILALVNASAPAVVALVKDLKVSKSETGEMTYELVINIGGQNLDDAGRAFQDVIDKANAELTRLGEPIIGAPEIPPPVEPVA